MKTICFEGINGCGKSTIIKAVKKKLEEQDKKVLTVVNPGTTQLGEIIRPIARQVDELIDPLVQLFLFCATKTHLIKTVLENKEYTEKYDVCLIDRFWLSTYVYQVCIGKCDRHLFEIAFLHTNYVVDRLVVIDADPEISIKRAKGDSRFENLNTIRQARMYYKDDFNTFVFGKQRNILDSPHIEILTKESFNIARDVLEE